jgi:hypothetical protein
MDKPTLDDELQRCRQWIEDALKYSGGTHDFEDIVQGVKEGRFQFWNGKESAAITEITVYPKKKILHVFLAGGKMEEIVRMNESAKIFAEINGCSAMTIAGRKGWERVLKKEGYEPKFTTLGLEL